MAGTTAPGGGSTAPRSAGTQEVTGWVGWVIFAGTLMTLIGVLHVFEGIIALVRNSTLVFPGNGLVVSLNSYTQYGWTQIIVGAVVFLAGLGILAGQTWARAVGVILAVVSVLVNFGFATAFPVWALTLIALDIFVIYALTAHGGEIKATSSM
jgi:hypothetical protein